ncbi:phage Gp37/Gp68 family protein [Pseudacidovorax sp. RU35E]|uniref:phage Gp37/Gp68 family protein n=1 Tax=Pseudacidovorax sp. RU35E TaxID=1907403 RepID=UPI0009560F6B|nr:phage Gp37/Gp68 family protein [Pseudacidovorax sp. RU35E]SIR05472.1 protein gp37 [Pseudacidovorax sp. RU35E]
MSDHSTIEWTDATWNPVTGCSLESPGCKLCYAMKLAGTRLKNHPSRAGLTTMTSAGPVWTGEIRVNEGWMEQPLQWTRPRMIFVCAHGDLFHEEVPDAVIDRVFAVMALARRHTFQVLTKRARRMRQYFAHPVREALIGKQIAQLEFAYSGNPMSVWTGLPLYNVWLGVSAEDQRRADERISELLDVRAAVRYLSLEPLLGPIQLNAQLLTRVETGSQAGQRFIDWVIVGGESGQGARPMHPDWARSLRDQCHAAGTAFFFKQWGEWMPRGPESWGYPLIDGVPRVRLTDTGEDGSDLGSGGDHHVWMQRPGKKATGRLLDGRTWDEMPNAAGGVAPC